MKTNIKILCAVAFLGLASQSCLKNQEDLFDKSPSARMVEYLSDVQKILMEPENGWVMYYFPDKSQIYGGFTYTLKFDQESVEVGFELATDVKETKTSLYRLGSDTGPMLSFDTQNPYIHYFATPSSKKYQGMGGDFEFMILEVDKEHVRMMGRRSGNIVVMYPLSDNSATYFDKLEESMGDFVIEGMKGNVGGVETTVSIDRDNRQLTFEFGEESTSEAFIYTLDGLRLYKPVTIGTSEFDDLVFDEPTFKVTLVGTDDVLEGVVPDGYRRFSEYAGDYLFVFNRENEEDQEYDTLPVTLVPGEGNSTYLMTGLNDNYSITWNYDRFKGTLTWTHQTLGIMENGEQVRLIAGDSKTTSYQTITTKVFGETSWNGDEANPVYYINAAYTWSTTRHSNAFQLRRYSAKGSSVGVVAANSEWRFPGGLDKLPFVYALVKK